MKLFRKRTLWANINRSQYSAKLRLSKETMSSFLFDKLRENKDIDKGIEIFTKTIIIESIGKFNPDDFIKFLLLITHDTYKDGMNKKAYNIALWTEQNLFQYFYHQTKITSFSQSYFIEDCFNFINISLIKEWTKQANIKTNNL